MVPNPEQAEAHFSQRLFSEVHNGQFFLSYSDTVGETRREASRGRLICGRKTCTPRQLADFLLAKSGLDQGTPYSLFASRLAPGPKISQIVGIQSIDNGGESAFLRQRCEPAVQFILAEVATGGGIFSIIVAGYFVGMNDLVEEPELQSHLECHLALVRRNRWTLGRNGQRSVT